MSEITKIRIKEFKEKFGENITPKRKVRFGEILPSAYITETFEKDNFIAKRYQSVAFYDNCDYSMNLEYASTFSETKWIDEMEDLEKYNLVYEGENFDASRTRWSLYNDDDYVQTFELNHDDNKVLHTLDQELEEILEIKTYEEYMGFLEKTPKDN